MYTIKIGKNELKANPVGLGAWAIGGEWKFDHKQTGWGKVDDKESVSAIQAALDAGINLIDTAANYGTGHSEDIVGQAVKGRRDKVLIATKFGFIVDEENKEVLYQEPKKILENIEFECERSLRHLDTDVIDLYQFHMWDFPSEMVPDLITNLEKLVEKGKIRSYGWSTDDVALARLFSEGENAAAIQHDHNVLKEGDDMFNLTADKGMASLIRGPLLMGFLSDKYNKDASFVETDVRFRSFPADRKEKIVENRLKVREILTSNGRTTAQGALCWLLAKGKQVLPIPGIRTVAQAKENAGAIQFGPLSDDQMTEIDTLLGR